MANKILYYPYVNLPQSNWTTKSILYWDEVGAIIPREFIDRTEEYGDQMLELVGLGLVRQVFPEEILFQGMPFSTYFSALMERAEFNMDQKRINFANGLVSRIHKEKFSHDLFNNLVGNGLAIRTIGEWYHVETETASLMMIYLASMISSERDYLAATDEPDLTQNIIYQNLPTVSTDAIRSQIIEDILPVPISPDFKNIAKFRQKYPNELRTFRRTLEKAIIDLANIVDPVLREERYKLTVEGFKEKKEELVEILSENNLGKIVWEGVKGFVADGGISLILGEPLTPLVTGYETLKEVVTQKKANPIKNEDLAYLALLEKNLK